jgi:thiol-disulfide isomerase/thioredoxin
VLSVLLRRRRGPTRRAVISALALAAGGGTLAVALPARQGRGAEAPEGLGRLRETEPPRPLPEGFGFLDEEGAPQTLARFAGQGVLLNFWATWCAPCVAEMPALDRLAETLAGEGFVVLALSSDRGGRAQVEAFYRRLGIRRLGIWLDPRGAAARLAGVRGVPTTILVDRAGMERARLEGAAAWDAPEFVAAVRRLTGIGAEPAGRAGGDAEGHGGRRAADRRAGGGVSRA